MVQIIIDTDRKSLSEMAFKIIRKDFGNQYSEKEIWKRIAGTSDDVLYQFCIERS